MIQLLLLAIKDNFHDCRVKYILCFFIALALISIVRDILSVEHKPNCPPTFFIGMNYILLYSTLSLPLKDQMQNKLIPCCFRAISHYIDKSCRQQVICQKYIYLNQIYFACRRCWIHIQLSLNNLSNSVLKCNTKSLIKLNKLFFTQELYIG